jgi:hypothetical protein
MDEQQQLQQQQMWHCCNLIAARQQFSMGIMINTVAFGRVVDASQFYVSCKP